MRTEFKQRFILGLFIFLSLTAIGFSYDSSGIHWYWQKMPFIAVFLMGAAFLLIKYWFKWELDIQREKIEEAHQSKAQKERDQWYQLLSPREKEVIQLILAGKRNKEIAETLFIELSTVKTHINNIYKILDVQNRREAIEKMQGMKSS